VAVGQPGEPEASGGESGTGPAFPQAARLKWPQAAWPSAATTRPVSGVPPWEITDSVLAVPSAPAETARPGPEPEKPVPPGGTAGAGGAESDDSAADSNDSAAESNDSTESFPAVDPGAEQRSFPRGHPGDGADSFPAARRRTDADAFRLFPPVRDTGNRPPATPADDDQH
jgi:hypothetical protein